MNAQMENKYITEEVVVACHAYKAARRATEQFRRFATATSPIQGSGVHSFAIMNAQDKVKYDLLLQVEEKARVAFSNVYPRIPSDDRSSERWSAERFLREEG
jgi:hypothetical protein